MPMTTREPERFRCENCKVGYALGKNIMMYILFEKKREKEIDSLWKKRIEPFEGDEFRMRFIEDGEEYAFVMYREPPEKGLSVGLCRRGLDANGQYANFKRSIQDGLLFTYGLSRGERFRLSERYKIIRDVEFITSSEIEESSSLWELLNRE